MFFEIGDSTEAGVQIVGFESQFCDFPAVPLEATFLSFLRQRESSPHTAVQVKMHSQ